MNPSISFRPLARVDFPLLQKWLSAPHVAAWWNETLDLAGVEAKYCPRVDGVEPVSVFVIEQESQPIGWIQWYLWSDFIKHASQLDVDEAAAGIDFAIGEPDRIGLGLGPIAIRDFVTQRIFTRPGIPAVVSDPEETNQRSLRAFEKAGFKVVRTVRLAGESCNRRVFKLERPTVCVSDRAEALQP